MNDKITLLDGSRLECHSVALGPDETVGSGYSPDTTGQYLQAGNTAHPYTDREWAERRKQLDADAELFYRHVPLFLANADRILSDSRLFLAPVKVANGLVCAGTSGFHWPTLGMYIEWWLYHKDVSIDKKERPIWSIFGSPMSGRNLCSAVDSKGRKHRACLNVRFSSVLNSFCDVKGHYNGYRNRYLAFDLKEVVDILEGTADPDQLFKLHLRLEKVRCDNHIAAMKKSLSVARGQVIMYNARLQDLIFRQNIDEAEKYYNKCVNLQTAAGLARQLFRKRRIELRKELRSGSIGNAVYQRELSPLKKRARETERQCREYEHERLKEIFGEDSSYMSFDVIESLLCQKK